MNKMAVGTRGPSGLWGRESILGETDNNGVWGVVGKPNTASVFKAMSHFLFNEVQCG